VKNYCLFLNMMCFSNSKARKVVYSMMQHITGIPRNQMVFYLQARLTESRIMRCLKKTYYCAGFTNYYELVINKMPKTKSFLNFLLPKPHCLVMGSISFLFVDKIICFLLLQSSIQTSQICNLNFFFCIYFPHQF
jgi:hypothetical protein